MLTIFDFDQTITINHTFGKANFNPYDLNVDNYARGKNDAVGNLKAGLDAHFQHNKEKFSAIATYHNNPDYIAGYVATLLKAELIPADVIYSETTPIAIKVYRVKDSEINFLISYIPRCNQEFQDAMKDLDGKNEQIEFLREQFLKQNLISENGNIRFYDDSATNYKAAHKLSYLDAFQVSAFQKNKFATGANSWAELRKEQKDAELKRKEEKLARHSNGQGSPSINSFFQNTSNSYVSSPLSIEVDFEQSPLAFENN